MLPSTNITVTSVKNILGENTTNLSELCNSQYINKWSKWKPQNINEPLTQSNINLNNWGLSVPVYNNPQLLYNNIVGNVDLYNYTKPTACRLGDFRNYNHSAFLPYGTGVNTGTVTTIKKGSIGYITYFNSSDSLGNLFNIGFDDINSIVNISTLYICVCIKISNTIYFTSSNDVKIKWDTNNTLKNYIGDAEIFICLCNTNYNDEIKNSVYNSNELFIPIPSNYNNINPYPVILNNNYASGSLPYYITHSVLNESGIKRISYNISFKADTDEYYGGTISTVYFNVYAGYPLDYGSQQIQSILLTNSATVTKNQSVDFNNSFYYSYYGSNQLWFEITVNGDIKVSGMLNDEQ